MKDITYLKNLYICPALKKKEKRIKRRLDRRGLFLDFYIFALPESGHGQLEIMKASLLRQEYYKNNPPVVAGFAKDYDSAQQMVADMALKVVKKTGDADIRSYILNNEDEWYEIENI